MAALGVCTNSPRCSKARSGEQVDFYEGFGEVCPECGRPLRKLAEGSSPSAASSASAGAEANAGGRATIVPPIAPPEPVRRPRRLITGHSPSEAPPAPDVPAQMPQTRAPVPRIPPIVPLQPEPGQTPEIPEIQEAPTAAAQPPAAAPPAVEPPPAPAPAIIPAPPAAQAPVPPAPVYVPPPPAPQATEAAAPVFIAPPAPPPIMQPAAAAVEAPAAPAHDATEAAAAPARPETGRWYIPTPDRAEDDFAGDLTARAPARRKIPRAYIFTGLGVALLAALGTFIYTLAGPLLGARATPAIAAFHVCGSRAIAGRLGANLAKAFFAKLGATDATVSPYGSTGLVVSASVPGRWQKQTIAIDTSDDSLMIASLGNKTCQVGMIATAADNRGALVNSGILGKVIGYDANVVVANPANPVSKLSMPQLAGIFSGSITNWSQVGGQSGPITVFAPDDPAHYLSAFRRTVLGGSSLPQGAKVVSDLGAVSSSVARDKNAIGFVGFVFADPGRVLKLSGSDGSVVLPTAATIGQRHYPLTIPVYLYNTAQQTEPMVFDFVDFARSDAGQTVVEDAGYVSRLSL